MAESAVALRPPTVPVLRCLVLCDLVDSTALTERLGDVAAVEAFRQHDRMARQLLAEAGGREVDKTDGFLLLFEHPAKAVRFALAYQDRLRELAERIAVPLAARVGIHVGDALVWENDAGNPDYGSKPLEVEGLAKPIVARLAGLANPGQILLSGMAYALTQRSLQDTGSSTIEWRFHGRYRMKGVGNAIPVYQVGDARRATFARPHNNEKAVRLLPWWRRPPFLALEALTLLAGIAIPLWLGMQSAPALAFGERDWIVIATLDNRTGQATFDDALDRAFRISLEQSRFVNVMPDLQVRDVLQRMNRTAELAVDRGVASEIALRDGARAVIVPTIAEVGGRVRFSAEVIDPHTQKTVYAESADGSGADSVLASVDTVARRLRGTLCEAVKTIDANSAALPKVSTSNLDALRAYALALKEHTAGRYAAALPLYEQAEKLDAGFALAYMGQARMYFASDDVDRAWQFVAKAEANRARLPARDQLYLDAWRESFHDIRSAIEKWKLLSSLYPDYFTGYHNAALFTAQTTNRYAEALRLEEHATSPHCFFRRNAVYASAAYQMALGQRAAALESFALAERLGVGGTLLDYANAYLVGREYDAARAVMNRSRRTGIATGDLKDRRFEVLLPLDQGRYDDARGMAWAVVDTARTATDHQGIEWSTSALALDVLRPRDAAFTAALAHSLDEAQARRAATTWEVGATAFVQALLVYVDARSGAPRVTDAQVARWSADVASTGYVIAEKMWAIARAQRRLDAGNTSAALGEIAAQFDGDELYQAHVVRMEIHAAAGRYADALADADWLAAHRGLAFGEIGRNGVGMPLNVADSNLALLRGAELALAQSQVGGARSRLSQFDAAWPDATAPDWVQARRRSLLKRLDSPTH